MDHANCKPQVKLRQSCRRTLKGEEKKLIESCVQAVTIVLMRNLCPLSSDMNSLITLKCANQLRSQIQLSKTISNRIAY